MSNKSNPLKRNLIRLGTLGAVLLVGLFVWTTYLDITLGIDIEGRLKRAADANQPSLAIEELDATLDQMDQWGLCTPDQREADAYYTSVLYRTPDEDLCFWRDNIESARDDLRALPEGADQLTKSNVLLKVRETIVDAGSQGGTKVTIPPGTCRYPHNGWYGFGILFLLLWQVVAWFGVWGISVGLLPLRRRRE